MGWRYPGRDALRGYLCWVGMEMYYYTTTTPTLNPGSPVSNKKNSATTTSNTRWDVRTTSLYAQVLVCFVKEWVSYRELVVTKEACVEREHTRNRDHHASMTSWVGIHRLGVWYVLYKCVWPTRN